MRPANGAERAALVLLALGETHGAPIWNELTDEEVALLTKTIARLGTVDKAFVSAALDLFEGDLSAASGIAGTPASAESLVAKVLPHDRSTPLLEQLRRPGGLDVWERLAALSDQILADYLAGEHPQTIAVILSRVPPPQSARVLARLDNDIALDCLDRMARIETVDPAVLGAIETTIGQHLIAPNSGAPAPDPTSRIADIFNAIDQRKANELLDGWRSADAPVADRVRGQMFTFDDFAKLSPATIQTLMRSLDKDLLGLALKAAPQEMRTFFMDQMSMRAARMFEDQMTRLGPVKRSEALAAQLKVVRYARDLEQAGELSLRIASADGDTEDMVE